MELTMGQPSVAFLHHSRVKKKRRRTMSGTLLSERTPVPFWWAVFFFFSKKDFFFFLVNTWIHPTHANNFFFLPPQTFNYFKIFEKKIKKYIKDWRHLVNFVLRVWRSASSTAFFASSRQNERQHPSHFRWKLWARLFFWRARAHANSR